MILLAVKYLPVCAMFCLCLPLLAEPLLSVKLCCCLLSVVVAVFSATSFYRCHVVLLQVVGYVMVAKSGVSLF